MVTAVQDDLRLEPLGATARDESLADVELAGDGPISIGRGRGCEVCLSDPTISRRHVTLLKRDGRWFVLDLGGRLGTFLNSVRLEPELPTVAAPGDFLRLGPYTFRFQSGQTEGSTITPTAQGIDPGTIVERVPQQELGSLAQRRLELLIDGAATICRATDEGSLAKSVVELAIAGSGYPRAAVLRSSAQDTVVEVVSFTDNTGQGHDAFSFSQSLLREATNGHIARLSRQIPHNYGQSIERLGISSAVCAPIVLDASVVGYLYLDSRENEPVGDAEGVGFCQALARLAGMALANLKRAELERRQGRLEADLRAARHAQAILCPRQEGKLGQLRYAAKTAPGRVVAGDLFDIFPVDDGQVAICFGDVSGQGIRAAIHMSAVMAHLHAAMPRYRNAAEAVSDLNRYIAERSPDDIFVSLWVGLYDTNDRSLRYVDAGHGHWFIRRRGGEPTLGPRPDGLLVGIDPNYAYELAELSLAEGDRVVFVSDGVSECPNAEGEQFGNQRAAAALAAFDSPAADVAGLFEAVSVFSGHAGVADDTTVASIELAAPGM